MNPLRARFAGATVAALLGLAFAVALFPFIWMVRTSLAPPDSVFFNGLSLLPANPDLSAFGRAWEGAALERAMLNGGIVVFGILFLQLATCIPAAYALSKLRFRGSGLIFVLILATLLIPMQTRALPTYIGLNQIGLGNTRIALILPFVTSGLGIYLLRQYMQSIPDAMLEAARVDGLSHLQTLRRIVIPLSAPGIAAFSILSVFVHWNDYLWPLLVVRSENLRTPPLSLAVFQQADTATDYAALSAAAVIVTIPTVLLFLLAQRRFVQGIAGPEVVG